MSALLAFVMNPLEKVQVAVDTTFAFMLAGQARGHRILEVAPGDVELVGDEVFLRGREVELRDQQDNPFTVREVVRVPASECGAIFIRPDPPFDQDYLTLTWMLSFAEKDGVRVVNSTGGLRGACEHLYGLNFPELCPEGLVSRSPEELRRFVESQGGEAIAKPIDGHAGFGVVRLRTTDSNMNPLIDMLTLEGKRPIIVQRFLEEGAAGDRRLLLIDGRIRGGVLRVPSPKDHRANIHVGGRAELLTVSDSDRAIEAAMGDRLRADGLFFVGLDVIADKLIEVNVTSPTLVRELHSLGGPDLAKEVVEAVAG